MSPPIFNPDNTQEHTVKFSPKTDRELAEANLWPAGEYDFEIVGAEDTQSKKSGADMIKLTVCLFRGDARKNVFDYLMDAVAYKVKHFCDAVGLAAEYERGELTAEMCKGRVGRCMVKVGEQPGYDPKNEIRDYVKRKEGVPGEDIPSSPRVPAKAAAGAEDDGIPF